MADDILTGLDIGSSMIRVAVAHVMPGEDGKPRLHVIGAVSSPSFGVHRGAISSLEDAVSAISKALEKAERMTGVAINSAWVGIAGQSILVQESRGVIGVSRTDADIKEDDVERAMEAARAVATPTNYDILHVIPKSFTVDGQRGVKDPVGMNGIRLEVDALIIEALASHIKNLTKSVYRTGLDIDDLVYTPLATAEAVVTQRQKELGVCVLNIGASSTTLAVFEEGDLLHTAVLPFGGDHITNDIAIGLRTSIDIAEQVKIAKHILRLPCSLGIPAGISSVIDEAHDPTFATAIGLAVWGHAIRGAGKGKFSLGSLLKFKSVDKVADQLRKWMKSLVP